MTFKLEINCDNAAFDGDPAAEVENYASEFAAALFAEQRRQSEERLAALQVKYDACLQAKEDLLEACKMALTYVSFEGSNTEIEQMKDAIAKAEGKV